MQYLAYLAGPISGCSFNGCTNWRDYVIGRLPPEIQGLSPMRGKTYLQGLDKISTHVSERHALNEDSKVKHLSQVMSGSRGIMTRDFNDCRRSDVILVNLHGADKVSIGTVMEIAWAKAFNIPVICVIDDGNLHDHPMINECVGFRVKNLDDAIDVLTMLLLPVPHKEIK